MPKGHMGAHGRVGFPWVLVGGYNTLCRKHYAVFHLTWILITACIGKEGCRREWLIKHYSMHTENKKVDLGEYHCLLCPQM